MPIQGSGHGTLSQSFDQPLDEDDDDDESFAEDVVEPALPVLTSDDGLLQVQQVSHTASPFPEPAVKPADNLPPVLVRLQRSWQEVINRMGSHSPSGAGMIKDATPIDLDGHVIVLALTNKFYVDRLAGNEKGRKLIEDVINKTLGEAPDTYRIRCVLADDESASGGPSKSSSGGPRPHAPVRIGSEPNATRPHEEPAAAMQSIPSSYGTAVDESLLDTVIAVFGGHILED